MTFRLKAAVAAALVAGGGVANALVVDYYVGIGLIATTETSAGVFSELDFVRAPSSGAFIDYINLAGPGGSALNLSMQAASASYNAAGIPDQGEAYHRRRVDFPNAYNILPNRFVVAETAAWSNMATGHEVRDSNLMPVNAFLDGQSGKLESCVRGSECGSTPPIPEPSTHVLMLAGLGVVGWMARRRRPV